MGPLLHGKPIMGLLEVHSLLNVHGDERLKMRDSDTGDTGRDHEGYKLVLDCVALLDRHNLVHRAVT